MKFAVKIRKDEDLLEKEMAKLTSLPRMHQSIKAFEEGNDQSPEEGKVIAPLL